MNVFGVSRSLQLCALFLLLLGCGHDIRLGGVSRYEPVGRILHVQRILGNSGSQFGCGVDHTGLGLPNFYDDLGEDAVVVGHETTGADDRCVRDQLTRLNAAVRFDLSRSIGGSATMPDPSHIRAASLTVSIRDGDNFSSIGCRTSAQFGSGVLHNVHSGSWLAPTEFGMSTPPPISSKRFHLGPASDGNEVSLREFMAAAGRASVLSEHRVSRIRTSRTSVTFELSEAHVDQLRDALIAADGAPAYADYLFVGTNQGTTTVNEQCLSFIEDIRLNILTSPAPRAGT
ncbi:hypothetical protein SAMN04488030_2893 [Aliiroseovarius halocynthiae]|nr:hypothetical protein SAMN04488030_2893 [Aliiroseovarius halocynthiae]